MRSFRATRGFDKYVVRWLWVIAFFAAVNAGLSGCASFSGRQNPINLTDPTNKDGTYAGGTPKIDNSCPSAAVLDSYYKQSAAQIEQLKVSRNRAIDDCVDAADESFRLFVTDLREQDTGFGLGYDIASLGLSTGSALASKQAAKTLATLSTGVAGAGAIVNKDLYYNATLPALLSAMTSHRTQILLKIRQGELSDPTSYSLSAAREDIREYVAAGSIDDAIEQITAKSVATTNANQTTIDELRSGVLSTSATTKTIVAWLFKDGKDRDAEGNALPADPTKWSQLQQWMSADKVDADLSSTPEYSFVYTADASGRLESDRARAIADPSLKIPPLKQ